MNDRIAKSLKVLFQDLGDSIDTEEIQDWYPSEFVDACVNVLINQNYDNICPFKNYDCANICHKRFNTGECNKEITIDCGLSAKEIWNMWILVN